MLTQEQQIEILKTTLSAAIKYHYLLASGEREGPYSSWKELLNGVPLPFSRFSIFGDIYTFWFIHLTRVGLVESGEENFNRIGRMLFNTWDRKN